MSKAEFAVELLRQYAKEHGTTARGTTDLSPLEQWLIVQLWNTQPKPDQKPHCTKFDSDGWAVVQPKSKFTALYIAIARHSEESKIVSARYAHGTAFGYAWRLFDDAGGVWLAIFDETAVKGFAPAFYSAEEIERWVEGNKPKIEND